MNCSLAWLLCFNCLRELLLQCVLLALVPYALFPVAQIRPIPQDLQTALADAMEERDTNFKKRLELVKEIDALVGATDDKEQNEYWLKARFVEAVANMRLNQLDLSATQIQALKQIVDAQKLPDLWFRCRSFSAALGLMRGERTESLRAFEELLAGDLDIIPKTLVDQARTNYAVALQENGRSKEASALYETIMLDAIEHHNDRAALHAGNNLLTMLIKQSEPVAARQLLSELEPLQARNPTLMVNQAIRLQEIKVLGLEKKNDLVIATLQEFINQDIPPPPVLLGSANRLLADALCNDGNLEQAMLHAEKAIELLQIIANESAEAYLTLARVQMKKHDYERVLGTLDKIDSNAALVPGRKRLLNQYRLEASLRQKNSDNEVDLLTGMLEAIETQNQQYSKNASDYFDSKLAAVHARMDTQQAELQSRMKAETDRLEQRNRYLRLTLISAASLSGILLLYLDYRRRAARSRLADEKSQNERLEAIVKIKTKELTATLEAKAEMTEALERKKRVETIGLLASNVAHDINNLLQVIANANESLANPVLDEKARTQALGVSNESLKHGSGIIRQLLAYSRQQGLTAQTIAVHQYLSECHPLFHSAIGDAIELKIEDDSHESSILVDPSQLTTTILNILSNAADAMPHGGKVVVKTGVLSLTENDRQVWPSLKPGSYVQFHIVDCGCGMNAEQVNRAFEPFFSTKANGKGTGLGLSSAQGFVKQSGGDIRLVSTLGVGTEVQFVLPAVPSSKPKPEAALASSSNSIENKRLLLVEDQTALATSLQALLAYLKLQTMWVASGEEAIELLRNDSNFDFVLSDVHMPGTVDGLALARWIHAERPGVKVLLMSGYHDVPFEELELPVLPKPFTLGQLASFLSENQG